MAIDTHVSNKNLVIYEVFVRNHGKSGTFADVTADLPRIKALGVDVVWLMPIHPLGEVKRKGLRGSPYANADYRAINPNYGTEAGFKQLIDAAHELDLKVMIDVVYNHTSPDSVLAQQRPDWFYRDAAGEPAPRFAEWSDVVDLVYREPALAEYQINSMLKWVNMGVDGFRCDVASLVPIEFWMQARQAVAHINSNFIWLAESVHLRFVRFMRRQGYLAHSDSELYQAFDITYDYDIHDEWQACVKGELSLAEYAKMLEMQEGIYPENFIKLRFVENHDQPRIAGLVPNEARMKCWTAFSAFCPGAFLIYAGQEAAAHHLPSLFDPDPIIWPDDTPALSNFFARLAALKKDPITGGQFEIVSRDSHLQARWQLDGETLHGIFNVRGEKSATPVELPAGSYTNLLDDTRLTVSAGQVDLSEETGVCMPRD